MKYLILILMGAALAWPAAAQYPQFNVVQAYTGLVPAAGSTNLTMTTPFKLASGGTMGLQMAMSAGVGTSNVIATLTFSIDGSAYANATVTVTNELNGTNALVFINSVTIPTHARYCKLASLATAQTNAPTVTVTLGQHVP